MYLKTMDKLERKYILEQQRRIKPGECLKYIKVVIDPEFLCGSPGSQVTKALLELGVKYEIRPQKVPRTILWEQSNILTLQSSEEKLTLSEKYTLQNEILLLIMGEEIAKAILEKTLIPFIKETKMNLNCKNITLLIFGLRNFCRSNNNVIKMTEIETALTELQIFENCSHRLHEKSEEISLTVSQFTKAIAEIPFKAQQADTFNEVNLFLLNDNKDCVRVDGTAGLSRLWQQHLTRLPLVTLETAEAITIEYPKPKILFEAYENNSNGEDILTDLKVRRAGGPLSSVRRVGPELSRKLYKLYNSIDPNEKL